MSNSPSNSIPFVPQNTLDPAAGLNLAIDTIDALLNTRVTSMALSAPPGSPADGDMYIVKATGTGDWAGHDNAFARYVATGAFWQFYEAGVQAWLVINLADGNLYKWNASTPAWEVAAGIGEAPLDGHYYGRKSGAWAIMPDGTEVLINPMNEAGSLIIGGAEDSHGPAGQPEQLTPGSNGQVLRMKAGLPAYGGDTFIVPLLAGSTSTGNDATNKRMMGGISFDPTDPQWGILPTSTVTLKMLTATTAAGNLAHADLYLLSGTGSPAIIATLPTNANTVASLVSVDVTAAFLPSATAGVFIARCWIATNNSIDECSCLGAWLEIKR